MAAASTAARVRRRPAPPAPAPARTVAVAIALAAGVVAGAPASAGSVEAGKAKVRSQGCVTCHGVDGQGTDPLYPNLAGQSEIYLEQQLKAFRSGRRRAPQMSIIAEGLSEADIADLAAYYASLSACGP